MCQHISRMNITLIGMPGSGKSFVGQKLATSLGFTLLQVDKLIEREYDLPLPQILEKLGKEAFLDTEAQTVLKNTEAQDNLVISPGGSVIYRPEAMDHLKKISKIFYLKVPLKVLEERIGNVPRGVVLAENTAFADLYAERTPLYEKYADVVLDGDADVESISEDIASAIGEVPKIPN